VKLLHANASTIATEATDDADEDEDDGGGDDDD